jgi:hypothetical protein
MSLLHSHCSALMRGGTAGSRSPAALWLVAFGLTHALYEWGDVFIPLQTQYRLPPLLDMLRSVQAVLLAASFAYQFQFGVDTLRPLPDRQRSLRHLPNVVPLTWIG